MRFPNSIIIKPVHSSTDTPETTPALVQLPSPDDAAEYAAIAGYWGRRTAQAVALLYVGKKVVDTAQQIAVVAATVHITK